MMGRKNVAVNKCHGVLESRKSKVRSFEILHYVSYQTTPIDVLLQICTALSIATARVVFHLLKLSLYSSPAFLFNSSPASPPHQQFQTCFLIRSTTSLVLNRAPLRYLLQSLIARHLLHPPHRQLFINPAPSPILSHRKTSEYTPPKWINP